MSAHPTPPRRSPPARRLVASAILLAGSLQAQDPPPDPTAPPQDPASAREAAPPSGQDPIPAAVPPESARWIRGRLTTRYWLRASDEEVDQDLFGILSLDVGDEERHAVTGHVMGRVTWDLDGYDRDFASINDVYGDRVDGLLYDAWVDFHRVDGFSLVRLGRQPVQETPVIAWFDGLHATTDTIGEVALQFGAYAGSSVHLYEASKTGDLTAGAYVQARPWTGGRVRFDYMHLEDRALLRSHEDDLYGLGVWQSIGQSLQLEGTYSRIAGEDRDVRGRATWRAIEHDLLLSATYYGLLQTQGSLVLEADPFFNALNELRPFNQWSLLLSKRFFERFQVELAADLRRVRDQSDIGVYNRDYDRWYATGTWGDVLAKGLSLGGTLDLWDSNGGELVRSWGADVQYALPRGSIALGTYYSLFKFDLFTATERDHVRTWFVRWRHDVSSAFTVTADYELEDTDTNLFHWLRLGGTWRF